MFINRLVKFILPLFIALLVTISSVSSVMADREKPAKDPMVKINLGFGTTISDEEVLKLLQRHNVVPDAAFMWTSGLTGSYRAYEAKNIQAFLKTARTKTIGMFENSLRGNQVRLQNFVEKYTEEEISRNADLESEARSLLNIRSTLEAGLAQVRKGAGTIYAIEVRGSPAQVERISKDKVVKASEKGRERDGKVIVPHTPKPDAYQHEYRDPAVQSMSVRDLYQQIKSLAEEGK